jgi:hypothetical protein
VSGGPSYRMRDRDGTEERVPEAEMGRWHNDRGLPWGGQYAGPDPITIRRMVHPGVRGLSLTVHLANEHGIDSDAARRGYEIEHMHAHLVAAFRPGQEHYHGEMGQ